MHTTQTNRQIQVLLEGVTAEVIDFALSVEESLGKLEQSDLVSRMISLPSRWRWVETGRFFFQTEGVRKRPGEVRGQV